MKSKPSPSGYLPGLRSLWGLFLLAVLAAAAFASPVRVEGATLNVGDYPSIQAAINAANPGDTIVIPAGTYVENLVTTVPLTIQGSGPATVIAPTSGAGVILAAGTDAVNRTVLSNLTLSGHGSQDGVTAGSHTTLQGVTSTGWSYGIDLDEGSDLIISNCHFDDNVTGLKLGSQLSFTGIHISDSSFDDNTNFGWYSDADQTIKPVLDDIQITNTSFSGNGEVSGNAKKGFYTERLSNAVFDNITVSDNANDAAYNFSSGMDINLKWRAYVNITIQNSLFSNNGNGSLNGSALTIKARDDAPAYDDPAATLSGVQIINTVFVNNERHYVAGEPGKVNAGPTNVVIEQSSFGASNQGAVVNHATAAIDANENYWGSAAGPGSTVSGNVSTAVYYSDASLDTIVAPVWNTTANTYFATIQEAIDAATAGDTIEIAAGTYEEEVLLNKELEIHGANAGIAAGVNPGTRGAETILDGGFIVSAAGAEIDGLTIRNGRNTGGVKTGIAVTSSADGVTVVNTIIEDVGIVPVAPQSDGLSTQGGTDNLTLTDSTIRNNWRGIYLNPGSGHIFLRNLIDANNGVGVGIGSDGQSNLTLTGNVISNHTLEGWGSSAVGENVSASENQFLNNGVSVAHYSGDTIDANGNYWGSSSGPGAGVSGDVEAIAYYTDAEGEELYSPVTNTTAGTYFATIQSAVDAASPGDVIEVSAGVYSESIITVSPVVIRGSEPGVVIASSSGTAVTLADGTESVRSVLENLTVQGSTGSVVGISVGSHATLKDVVSTGHFEGVILRAGEDLEIEGGSLSGNSYGLHVPVTVSYSGIVVSDTLFEENTIGWLADADGTVEPELEGVHLSDVTFLNNVTKGFYTERLSDSILERLTVTGNGSGETDTPGTGVELNLKWRDYANVVIKDSHFGGNGVANNPVFYAQQGALAIKARDDGSYAGNPASLSNLTVSNNVFDGNGIGLSLGEPNKGNAEIESLTIEDNKFLSAETVAMQNDTSAPVDGRNNYWGPGGPGDAAVSGSIGREPYYTAYDENGWPTGTGLSGIEGPVLNITQGSYHPTIQEAIDQAIAGDTIEVGAGTFVEDVALNKSVTLKGSGVGSTVLSGPIGGAGNTIHISASNAVVRDFTITRQGNNLADWNNPGLNTAGIGLLSPSISGVVIHDNLITGMRTGIDINNTSDVTVRNNVVTNNHTGFILRNKTDNLLVEENEISGNRTVGILFLDASSGTNIPVQQALGSIFRNNKIVNNWYGQVVDRQAGGTLPVPGTTNTKNFAKNWLGSAWPVATTANSAELGYASLIPVEFGGEAEAPQAGSQPDIAGAGSANIKWAPSLTSGIDTDIPTEPGRGSYGFQGDLANFDAPVRNVTDLDNITYHETIQSAINAASPGDTIAVSAGTYAEDIVVDRSVKLYGPNVGIDPVDGVRVAEATLIPGTDFGANGVVVIEAADVEIDGFTIDGDNPALASGVIGTNGADFNTFCAVYQETNNAGGIVVSNNRIKNILYFGVHLYGGSTSAPPTTGNVISSNLMEDFGTYQAGYAYAKWGGGVLLHNDHYTRVVDNVMTNVRLGIQTGNFHKPNPGSSDYQVISGNEIQARRLGIFYNMHYSTASPFTISGNTITGLAHAEEVSLKGILHSSQSVASFSQDNIIDFSSVSGVPTIGYEVWNVKSTTPAVISGGSVSGAVTGIFVNNYEGYNSNAPDGGHATVSGIAINVPAGGSGIRVLDSPSSTSHGAVSLAIGSGVSVAGGARGITVENANASVSALGDLVLSGQSGNYIELIANAGNLDATGVLFDGKIGSAMNTGELLEVENKLMHKPDDGNLGLITFDSDFDLTSIQIDDDQTFVDFHVPAGAVVTISESGSLTVTGGLSLASGASLQVNGGSLTFPDGTTLAGTFTFFNSFGSVNFDGDVTIAGSAEGLILVSDVHVANGATITVEGPGSFTIDGCTVDSDGTFDLVVEAGAEFTMARTAFSDGHIEVESGAAKIFDNHFSAGSSVHVAAGTTGARVYHNVLSNVADITDAGTGTVLIVDTWGNIIDPVNSKNNLPLAWELAPAEVAGKRTIDAAGIAYIQPGDAIAATLSVSKLQGPIVGAETLVGYNTDFLTVGTLGLSPDWDVMTTTADASNVIGKYDTSLFADLVSVPASGTDADQTLADISFTAMLGVEGETQVFHRVKLDTDAFPGDTTLVRGAPVGGSFAPFTSNTPLVIVDSTPPVLDTDGPDAGTEPDYTTITQGTEDLTQVIAVQGLIEISTVAFDALAGIDDVDAVVTLVGPASYVATPTLSSAGPTIGSDDYTTYGFQYLVSDATLNGIYDVVATVTDRSGNEESTTLGSIEINKNEISATVRLEYLTAAPVTRDVTFEFTDGAGTVLDSRTRSVDFVNGIGSVNFTDVPLDTVNLSAKATTHLRRKMTVTFDGNGQGVAAFDDSDLTVPNADPENMLLGGDLNGDNIVNLHDYAILKYYWLNAVSAVPAAAAADIDGNGVVNMTDFQILQSRFYTQGNPQ